MLLTGIARNYDQLYFRETPFWLIGPLLFSLFSGSFLFGVVQRFVSSHQAEKVGVWGQWRSFMGLFWMTAPVAWLYAVPVERFLGSYEAALANLTLLAIVSIWRVLLMSRILSVVWEVPFLHCLGWVLVAASIEVIGTFLVGGIAGGQLEKGILAGMSGMRNSPEEDLILSTLAGVWKSSWLVLMGTSIALAARQFEGTGLNFPRMEKGKAPVITLLALSVVWIALAFPAQREQQRYAEHAALLDGGQHKEAIEFLGRHQPADFPPGRRLRPSPYEREVWTALPKTIAMIDTNTPAWVRELYLSHLGTSTKHRWSQHRSLEDVAAMFKALELLPESRAWLKQNENALARQEFSRYYEEKPGNTAMKEQIKDSLKRMGLSETNLALFFQ